MMDQNRNINKNVSCEKRKLGKTVLLTVLAIVGIFILTVTLTFIFYSPRVDDRPHFSVVQNAGTRTDTDSEAFSSAYERKEGFYTFLVAGIDAFSNNTDVLMLASLDTENGKLEIVQIPRDTYINKTAGGYKSLTRINAVYAAEYNRQIGEGASAQTAKTRAMQDLAKRLSEALCVNIDEYILVDTKGFRGVIDAVGGIDYDVPCDMLYEDPAQDLYIDLKKGYQHLDGAQCEQLIRYRSGYATGDIGRVEMRGDFMAEVFTQVKNKIGLDTMLKLIRDKELMQQIRTSMSMMDMLAYVRMAYRLDDGAIGVRTLAGSVVQNPDTGAWIYYCLNKKSALRDINDCLNIYKTDIDIAIFDREGFFSGTKGASDHYLYEYYNS
jgi:LCP family protein required for cell wall assembly